MTTVAKTEARIAQLAELRDAADRKLSVIQDAATAEARALTTDEVETLKACRAEMGSIDAEVRDLTEDLRELRAAEESEAPAAAPAEERTQVAADVAKGGARVVKAERTYEPHDVRNSYFRDLLLVEKRIGNGDPVEARKRLERHAAEADVDLPGIEARMVAAKGGYRSHLDGEERGEVDYEKRALNRTDGTGGYFVPPLWAMEQWIDLARGGRVTANLVRNFPLPAGTDSINVPKVSTGTATAIQTADNAAVQETDLADTSVQANVKTIAGQQKISIQALEQSPLAFDQIIIADLAGDHAVKTDVQVLDGSNASGQVRGILTIASVDTTTYTDASPTVPELYPKLADSANVIATTRYMPAEAIIMHPRRWYWMLAQVDSSNRPLVAMNAQGPNNALLRANDGNPFAEGGAVGVTPFGPIYIDPNVPTTEGGGTEDVIILTRPSDLYLWESAPRTRILEETAAENLQVLIQLYNYLAFMPDRRPESTSIVSGTGLAAPTF